MSTQISKQATLSTPHSLKIVGLVAGSIGLLGLILSTIVYAAVKPRFALLKTYLSGSGATPIWPQIFFNTSMLIVSPLRHIVLVLRVLRRNTLEA